MNISFISGARHKKLIVIALVCGLVVSSIGVAFFGSTLLALISGKRLQQQTSCTRETIRVTGNGSGFSSLAYDPHNGYVYSSTDYGLIAIDSKNQVVGNVSLGFPPLSIVYLPASQNILATNGMLLEGALLNPSSGKLTTPNLNESINLGRGPFYNPTLKVYYVPSSNGFYIVNAASGEVESVVNLSLVTKAIAYDGANGMIYLVGGGDSNHPASFYAVKSGTNTVVTNISAGANVVGIVADSSDGYVYVMNEGYTPYETTNANMMGSSITVIDTKTNAVVKTISLVPKFLIDLIYVKQDDHIYVLSLPNASNGAQVLGINGKTNSVDYNSTISYTTIANPFSIAYDPVNTCLYIGGTSPQSTNVVTIPAY